MNEKRKWASPSALPVNHRRPTISTEKKLGVIIQPKNGVRIVDKRRNVWHRS